MQSESPKKDRNRYVSPLERQAPTAAAKALQSIFPPGTTRSEMVAFFRGRAAVETIRSWRYGKHNPPRWALDLIAAYGAEISALSRMNPPGDAPATGTEALRRWRQEQREKKNAAR